jgi:hypothetical protein
VSERVKLGMLCVLLLLALGCVAFTAVNTVQAMRNLQRQYSGVRVGDVSTIRPWMTIRAVSHVYHVPEDYLYRSLDIANTNSSHHATLYEIASRKRWSVEQTLRAIQHAIVAYRKGHPPLAPPTPRSPKQHLSPTPRRTKY